MLPQTGMLQSALIGVNGNRESSKMSEIVGTAVSGRL